MRVAIVSCVYTPEPGVSGRTSAEIARALVERGDAVKVITSFPSRPAGHLYAGYSRRPLRVERGNPTVIRCFSFFSAKSRVRSRLLENVSFGVTSSLALLGSWRPDVIYSNSWPIFASALVLVAARLRRIPVVLTVQDIYPESLLAQGRVGAKSLVERLVRRIDKWIARTSRSVIVISEGFAEIYGTTRGLAMDRIHVVPNWGTAEAPVDSEGARPYRNRLGVRPDERLLVYGGNVGVAAGIETLLEAVEALPPEERVRVVVAGAGSEMNRVRATASRSDRIIVLSPWPEEETAALLGAADVLLLPTRGTQSLASVPSKLISYTLAARPVLAQAMTGSDVARMLESTGAGWVVKPDDSLALTKKIIEILRAPESELTQRGAAGRRYALEHFSSGACLPRILAILDRAAEGGSRR